MSGRKTGRFIGAIGELLITAGIVVGLFFVWQVWWTSIQAEADAGVSVAAFRDELPPSPRTAGHLRTDSPPVPERAAPGEVFGTLIVPRWYGRTANAMPVMEGTASHILDQAAAGHFTSSQMVGEVGNFALAGHRRSYGNSFRHVNLLEPGDQIIVETEDAWYVYEVFDHEIVLPRQVEVVAPVPNDPRRVPTERLLTLTTCHSVTLGEFGNDHRWITYARFAGWMARTDGMPEQVLHDPEAR